MTRKNCYGRECFLNDEVFMFLRFQEDSTVLLENKDGKIIARDYGSIEFREPMEDIRSRVSVRDAKFLGMDGFIHKNVEENANV